MNLDEVERMLEKATGRPVACVGRDEKLMVMVESPDSAVEGEARRMVSELYHIHHSAVLVSRTESLAVSESGKKDYAAILRELSVHDHD